jgi:raffinose/stachyose/melibiose transport system permease protein
MFRYSARTFARECILVVVGVVFAVPLFLLAVLSLKSNNDMLIHPNSIPRHPEWSNYSLAWAGGGIGSALVTSAIITLGSVMALIVVGLICAYTLARRQSRLSTGVYLLFVLGIILPFQLAILPIYVVMRKLHLTASIFGMIVLYTGLLIPLTVFLYAGFVRALPRDYEEAAYVDGASFWRTFRRVVLPLLRPVTGTVAILTGLIIWNDFFASLIFLYGSKHETLPVAIYSFVGEYETRWNYIFAAVVISIAPVLAFFVFAQRQMIRGFSGGIRG